MITPGERYTHYKRGGEYEIVDIAILQTNGPDDGKQVVIYKQLHDAPGYQKGTLWVRPIDMFLADVGLGDERVKRFKKI